MKPKLLIVDDDDEIRTQMKWALNADHEILLAEDRPSGVEMFRAHSPAVALLDLGLPPHAGSTTEGFALLGEILAADKMAKVIIITGQNEREHALQAIASGAYDFLCKPVNMDELKILIKRCFHVAGLERENRTQWQNLGDGMFEGMLGTGKKTQEMFSAIRKVAATEAPVLLLGESGTGKEKAALAIHCRSRRNAGPFVAINCGAIPDTLLESELFGHEKGAFTGAHVQRKGRIESADGGTLFLDEIGELPPPLQVKLLRFLQEQRLSRIGGREEIKTNVRVIAATNADLKGNIVEGKFREDLYYRLAVVTIMLPPLRERGDDAKLLAQIFLERFAAENGKSNLSFQPDALRALNRHTWPGNIRELENRVKRAVIMTDSKRVSVEDLELNQLGATDRPATLKEARENLEREMVQQVLQRHSGKISSAAQELGISRPTLYELMEKLGISRE
ncbi:MAG: PEP-CTERM-box response regulator transcription factor [Verrucomicrobiota bacterium]